MRKVCIYGACLSSTIALAILFGPETLGMSAFFILMARDWLEIIGE